MCPCTGIVPYAAVCPIATVPSWQLRQRLLDFPIVGCELPVCLYVVLVYGVYVCEDSVWFHSGVTPPNPLCGAWQNVQPRPPPVVTEEPLPGDMLCIPSVSACAPGAMTPPPTTLHIKSDII